MKYKIYPGYVRQGMSSFAANTLGNCITPQILITSDYVLDKDTQDKLMCAIVEAAEKVMKEVKGCSR